MRGMGEGTGGASGDKGKQWLPENCTAGMGSPAVTLSGENRRCLGFHAREPWFESLGTLDKLN